MDKNKIMLQTNVYFDANEVFNITSNEAYDDINDSIINQLYGGYLLDRLIEELEFNDLGIDLDILEAMGVNDKIPYKLGDVNFDKEETEECFHNGMWNNLAYLVDVVFDLDIIKEKINEKKEMNDLELE